MQVFEKSIPRRDIGAFVQIGRHRLGIGDSYPLDETSDINDWQDRIEKLLKFSHKSEMTSFSLNESWSTDFIKYICEANSLVYFVGYLASISDPLSNLEEMNALIGQVKNLCGTKELYVCKMILNSGERVEDAIIHRHELIDLYYKSKYPSPALARMAEFMNRVMGEGDNFPNYTFGELLKIAARINQENFNFGTPRTDAIPKYEIGPNGRPAILG